MVLTIILGALTLLSVVLLLWQFTAALRFPLHLRIEDRSFAPTATLLKPLKGFDEHTADSLRSWLEQDYCGQLQIFFGVADADDPVCQVVRALLRQFPCANAELVICPEQPGPNAKVSTLIQLERHARGNSAQSEGARAQCSHPADKHRAADTMVAGHAQRSQAAPPDRQSNATAPSNLIVISDSDVRVPSDFLTNALAPLRDPAVGLVNCLYQLANPATLAMRWEAIAINADFWSQVLQSNCLKPQNFALGAVMITTHHHLDAIGGFEPLVDYLADDYQLGHRIAKTGARIELCPIVVECWEAPMDFRQVWAHQLRWARTIRASQSLAYFFSVLSNVTLWATLLVIFGNAGGFPVVPDSMLYSGTLPRGMQSTLASIQVPWVLVIFTACLALRAALANALQARLTRNRNASRYWWLTISKDFLQFAVWLAAFAGNAITWRGRKFRVERGGRLRSA